MKQTKITGVTREISGHSGCGSSRRHELWLFTFAGTGRGVETGAADQPDRALGRGRLDRSDHPAGRRRDGEIARPDHRDYQPARRFRLDRDAKRAKSEERRVGKEW